MKGSELICYLIRELICDLIRDLTDSGSAFAALHLYTSGTGLVYCARELCCKTFPYWVSLPR